MSEPVNGHGAVDLAAVKQLAEQRERLAEHRDQLTSQLLTQIGLICPCGQRIRGEAVIYFDVLEQVRPTPQGPQVDLQLLARTFHSRQCPHAIIAEASAIAMRNGPAGRVTWLDERRAARHARQAGE